MDRETARLLALKVAPKGLTIADDAGTETETGWHFHWTPIAEELIGTNGVFVNKRSGRTLVRGSAIQVERDIRMYDLGYQFESYDLVITRVRNSHETVKTILGVGPVAVEPSYEHGTVWRIPRRLTGEEIWSKLEDLPTVFGNISLYRSLEALEEARAHSWFEFLALEYKPNALERDD